MLGGKFLAIFWGDSSSVPKKTSTSLGINSWVDEFYGVRLAPDDFSGLGSPKNPYCTLKGDSCFLILGLSHGSYFDQKF